jgi:hypothetical protein
MQRIFILSPARMSGKRGALLLNERANFDLAARLRSPQGASIGEVFTFVSGLYFRGKFAYAKHFALPPGEFVPPYVITSNAGLMSASELVTRARLKEFEEVRIDLREPCYTKPLQVSVDRLARTLSPSCEVVLLGSIATSKYVDILLESFGARLMFPREFIGRGDMSRGGLLLRAVKADEVLEYVSLSTVESRRGRRPPKLSRETN